VDPLVIRRPRSTALAAASLALMAWSLLGFVQDQRLRGGADAFARRFTLDRRRPLEVAGMSLERSPDGASAVAVDAALEDARGSGPPVDLEPEARALWVQAALALAQELESSRNLMLDAVAYRPGSARNRFLLGSVVYTGQARSLAGDPQQWIEPLTLAASAAPGLAPIFSQIGGAYLESWPRLSPEQRAGAAFAWQKAFADPGFVTRALLPAGALVGRDEVVRLLPADAASLRAAFDALARDGDVSRAAALRPRLEKALREDRDLGIAKIGQRLASGDLEGARSACQEWLVRSPAGEFDDPSGRAQAALVLELWPSDTGGAWRTDPRGELARFFLNRREKDVRGDALLRATDALTGVPDTVRARVRFLAGDAGGADDVLQKSGSPGSLEWAPYLTEVARGKLASGDAGGARAVLKGLSPSAADGCDVLLLRRDVAVALGDEAERAAAEERLRWLRRGSLPAEAWSAAGSMSLCLDDKAPAGRRLRISIDAAGPAIVAFGWNGGREGSVLVPKGPSTLTLPLPPLAGRQILSVSSEAGAAISLGSATIANGG
jgi:hypothetical protein